VSADPATRRRRKRFAFGSIGIIALIIAIASWERREDLCRHCAAERIVTSCCWLPVLTRVDRGTNTEWCEATFGPCPGHRWLRSSTADLAGISCMGPGWRVTTAYMVMQVVQRHDGRRDFSPLRSRLESASDAEVAPIADRIVRELMSAPTEASPPSE
jgi:hypothetical protein